MIRRPSVERDGLPVAGEAEDGRGFRRTLSDLRPTRGLEMVMGEVEVER